MNTLFVVFELLQIVIKTLLSLHKLVLLQDDLSQLPFAEFAFIFLLSELLGNKWLKGLVCDCLTEVDALVFFVELCDPTLDKVIHDHTWRLEA